MLSSLSLQPTIRFACVYNAKGRVFATTEKEGRFLAAAAPADGHEFVAGDSWTSPRKSSATENGSARSISMRRWPTSTTVDPQCRRRLRS